MRLLGRRGQNPRLAAGPVADLGAGDVAVLVGAEVATLDTKPPTGPCGGRHREEAAPVGVIVEGLGMRR